MHMLISAAWNAMERRHVACHDRLELRSSAFLEADTFLKHSCAKKSSTTIGQLCSFHFKMSLFR